MDETIITGNTLDQTGVCALIYGKVGVGKTDSLLTLPDPLLLITTEPKDIKRTVREHMARHKQAERKIKLWRFANFDEYIQELNNLCKMYEDGKKPFQSIGFDSLSFAQQLFKLEMEDSRFGDRLESKQRADTFIDKFRMEQGDWGGLKSAMIRLTRLLNSISSHGVNVVATSAMTEFPRWNQMLEAAPDFEGGYASVNAGFFDLVGFVQPNVKTPDFPFPPVISFAGDRFVSRCCSDTLIKAKQGEANFGKILKVLNAKKQSK